MSLKTFKQLQDEVVEYLGMTSVDETTEPKLSRIKSLINDSISEVLSEFNYRQLETSCRLPFTHTINVQSAFLSGLSINSGLSITGSISPYPADNYAQLVNCTQVLSYSGIVFTGTDISGNTTSGLSNYGYATTSPLSTIGLQYELPYAVDQIYSVTLPSNSIKLSYCPQYDFDRMMPIGLTISSGTPTWYTEFEGISDSGNKVIQFYPQPIQSYWGDKYFTVHYKKRHIDLVNDSDLQNVIPPQFQDIIIYATLERVYGFLSDERSEYHRSKKLERTTDLKLWADNHLDFVFSERDGNALSSNINSAYNTTIAFRL